MSIIALHHQVITDAYSCSFFSHCAGENIKEILEKNSKYIIYRHIIITQRAVIGRNLVTWPASAQRDANTARPPQSLHRRTESAMAVVRQSQKNPPPPQTLPGAQGRQNLISWRQSLPAPTDPVWWRSIYAISSYRGNRYRPPARCHKPTDRTDYNTLRRS